MDERLPASDHDRERAVRKLKEHYVQGRIDKEELDERTRAALTAKRIGDLQALTRDLPSDPPPDPPPPDPAIPEPPPLPQSTLTWLGFAATAVTIVLLVLAVGLFENIGHFVTTIIHEIAHVISSI